jgi:hypothetical protein
MIKKDILEEHNGCFSGYEQCIDEPISDNICDAINDFYNMLHLIYNSWVNENFELKMRDAGYDIYNKNGELEAWVGITEKSDCLEFRVYSTGKMAKKIWSRFDADGSGIYIFVKYSELTLNSVSKEKTEEKQRKIVKAWITETLGRIFLI